MRAPQKAYGNREILSEEIQLVWSLTGNAPWENTCKLALLQKKAVSVVPPIGSPGEELIGILD